MTPRSLVPHQHLQIIIREIRLQLDPQMKGHGEYPFDQKSTEDPQRSPEGIVDEKDRRLQTGKGVPVGRAAVRTKGRARRVPRTA